MSKENAVLFIKAANRKPALNARLVASEDLSEWVDIARDAGFEFTADDFVAVLEETTQKKITKNNAVPEFLLVREAIGAGELSRRALYAFIGGIARRCDFQSLSRPEQSIPVPASDSGTGRE
jgi:predicted ribosomally synthesized peptide with nif11-like leader